MTKRTPAEIAKQWEDMGKVPRRPKTLLEIFTEALEEDDNASREREALRIHQEREGSSSSS